MGNVDIQRPNRSRLSPRAPLGVAVLAAVALVVTGCVGHSGAADTHKAAASLRKSWLREHPPVAGPTVVDRTSSNRTVYIWVSMDEQLCIGALGAARGGDDGLTCSAAPSVLRTEGPPALASKPLPQAVPHESNNALLIGAVRGSVASVELTVFGATVTSPVIRLPAKDHRVVGAYAAWVPMRGHDSIGWADVTRVTARDKDKRLLHQLA